MRLLALILLCACGIGCGVPPEGRFSCRGEGQEGDCFVHESTQNYYVISDVRVECPFMHLPDQQIDCVVYEDQDQWVEREMEWHSPQKKWEILENDY